MSQTDSEDLPSTSVSEAASDFGASLSRSVRDNPLPAALVGMGVAWLFFGGSKVKLFGNARSNHDLHEHRGRHSRDHETHDHMDFGPAPSRSRRDDGPSWTATTGAAVGRAGSSIADTASAAGSGVANAASTAASYGTDAAGSAYEGITRLATGAGGFASDLGSSAYDASYAATRAARRGADHLGHTLSDFFEDQPLALGVLGLAIGAGIAAALPATETESRLMGEASDDLKQKAVELASDGVEAASKLMSDTAAVVGDEASSQGLDKTAATDALKTVGDKLSTVAQAATEAVKKEVGAI
jgi:hypothetical protein